MISRRTLLITPIVLLVFALSGERTWSEEGWKAGVGKANITPTSPMWMAGYAGRDHVAEGKLTDLWAKSLVLEDSQGRRAVLVTMDLIGIDRGLSSAITGQLKQRYGLERHQIALNTSHTHTGPVVARNLRPMHYVLLDDAQKKLVDAYADRLKRQVVESVGQALRQLRPAQIKWGSGVATFAVNRRNNPEAEVPQRRKAGTLSGPVDHDVPVLAIHGEDEKPLAIVFGYACHATVLSFYQWSGDYPGFAQQALEESLGCSAMFWAGCGGDINPLPRRDVALARDYGRRLAQAVSQVVAGPMQDVAPKLHTSYREIDLPLGPLPTKQQLEADAASSNRFMKARAAVLLAQVKETGELPQVYPYPIAVWRIGDDVRQVFLGGEVVVDYAIRLKAELTRRGTWVAGYSNDVMAYIPSRRVLGEGGYEGGGAMLYYGLPTSWAPEVENDIVREVHAQLTGNP